MKELSVSALKANSRVSKSLMKPLAQTTRSKTGHKLLPFHSVSQHYDAKGSVFSSVNEAPPKEQVLACLLSQTQQ